MDLSRLFAPRSIAVVGATDRAGSYGNAAMTNLLNAQFPGELVGVNRTRTDVHGVRCVPSLLDLAAPVDAVVVATPADTVPDILRQAGAMGCGGAVVFAADFAETGRSDRQDLLVDAAAEHGLPVIGPNANGIVSVPARAPMWGDSVTLDDAGGVALVTQSGNLGVVALASLRGIAWHTVVSVGNSAVVDAAASLAQLAVTRGVKAVALYLEGDGDGSAWAEAFALCVEHDVRVAVLKAGRSKAGAVAGGAHTAAVAGDHRIFAALVEDAGGAWCHDPHELLETAKLLATPPPATPGAIAVVTCSGGDCVIAADEADRLDVPLAELSVGTTAKLASLLPDGVVVTNPLDHTNMVWADTARIRSLVEVLAADPAVNQVLYIQDIPPNMPDTDAAEWKATRDGLVTADVPGVGKAVASGLPELMPASVAAQLADEGVPALGGIPTALLALKAHTAVSRSVSDLRNTARAAAQLSAGDIWLAEHEAKDLLQRYGVTTPDGVVATTPDEAVAAAQSLGTPVALKLSHRSLQHKSDVGGVLLGLDNSDEIRAGAERLLSLQEDASLLVEQMAPPGVEMLVGATRDGVVPALVVGMGGIWTELLDDAVIIPLPADVDRVIEALARLRGLPMLTGTRGQQALDVDALARVAVAAGRALVEEPLQLVELNPVIVSQRSAVAVDAVVRTPLG